MSARPGVVAVIVRGSERLRELLCAPQGESLASLISAAHPDSHVAVSFEPGGTIDDFHDALDRGASAAFTESPALVILSVDSDIAREDGQAASDPIAFHRALTDVVRRLKQHADTRVIVLNASSFDPADETSDYRGLANEPNSLSAHRINLEALRLSFEEGISVIDVDRIVAELGGGNHVPAFLHYSPEAQAAIRAELVEVMEEYGFFDDRPLLQQVGRAGAAR